MKFCILDVMISFNSLRSIAAILVLLLISNFCSLSSEAQVPLEFTYQGRIADDKGVPITGSVTGVFSIIKGGDSTSPVALPAQVVHVEINEILPDVNGVFSQILGGEAGNPISLTDITEGDVIRWISVTIDGAELLPRQQIVSVPFAMTAVGVVPVGAVIMWWGPLENIPANFELCNGNTVSTPGATLTGFKPNLINRFAIGADDTDSILSVGGSHDFPTHRHGLGNLSATTSIVGANADVSLIDPGHSHLYARTVGGNSYGDNSSDQKDSVERTELSDTGITVEQHPHLHGASTVLTGTIGHLDANWNGDDGLAGGNRPAYQELFFIIRVL